MADSIHVKLPDGSVKEVPKGTTALDIAKSISPRLADAALAAKTNGDLIDLTRPLEKDTDLRLLTDKDPESLEVYRHSSAHLLAAAVLELFPRPSLATVRRPRADSFTTSTGRLRSLRKIWKRSRRRCRNWCSRTFPTRASFCHATRDWREFKKEGDFMKCHFIEQFTKPDEKISIYRTGKFTDFCRGPHIPSTGKIKAFKLLNIAGAYWLGDEKNPQLQRIYGTSFFSKKDLDDYLNQVEEAKKRDHRVLGKQLDLFSIQELAGPGLIFWHPKGGIIRKEMEDWMREQYLKRGYSLVYTPHVARRQLVLHLGARGLLLAEHVRRHGTRRCRISAEADELPRPHSDLQRLAEVVSRSAGAAGRIGHGLSLRAFGRDARPVARSRFYAGRLAHLLHAGAD